MKCKSSLGKLQSHNIYLRELVYKILDLFLLKFCNETSLFLSLLFTEGKPATFLFLSLLFTEGKPATFLFLSLLFTEGKHVQLPSS